MKVVKVDYADNCDFQSWIDLLELVKESFPGLDLKEYKNVLHQSILNQEALIAKNDKGELVGELIFSRKNCELAFLAIHPRHRKKGIATNLIQHMFDLFPKGTNLKVITYREGDVKGIAARKLYQSIGFIEGKFITVFNYPCQELNYII
ncbi:GNAT family N-acetyltransferase [Clostridium autoethanogenum]|uniref:GNAT family N-acetyltransferase n=1 Tax=Clostridium autoethanogenum TaxID=84023 RepID=A0A3M0T0M4_9CLOT|nr:GNAT family N-acetyltransferase [Clostridium autoethanogenum]